MLCEKVVIAVFDGLGFVLTLLARVINQQGFCFIFSVTKCHSLLCGTAFADDFNSFFYDGTIHLFLLEATSNLLPPPFL